MHVVPGYFLLDGEQHSTVEGRFVFLRRQLTYDDGKKLLALKRLIVKLRLNASFSSQI